MYKKTRSILLVLVSLLCFLFLTACGTSSKDNTSEKDKKEPTKTYSAKTIDTNELKDNLTNQNYVIVDLRKDEAFNGWKIDGISRGGHIKNSVHFPTTWLKEVKGDKLSSLLKKKGITSDKTIVLYHSDNNESKKMASKLNELNYSNILVYDKLDEWANNESLPMDALPNYEKLVYPEWVNDLINDKNPETYPGKGYVIIETSWGRPSKYYTSGHIPGTVHLDTNEIESESDWNIGPVSKIEKTLKKFGITPDTTVILYSENTMEGARGALAMMWAGVKDVRLLNGNLKAWKDAGFKTETKNNTPTPIKDFGLKIPQHPEYILPLPKDVLEKQKDPNFVLASIRSWDEFIGKISGYDYIKETGEPKGAVWGHAGSSSNDMEDFEDVDGTLRSYPEIVKMWEEWGITSDKEVSFYCGTGWRAAETWFIAYLMDWPNINVYDGGWFLWSMDKNNPVQKGDPRKK